MKTYFCIIVTVIITTFSVVLSIQNDCKKRDYGNGNTVCVCDDTYCDTLPKPEKIEAPKYLKYTSNKDGLRFKQDVGKFEQINKNLQNTITVNSEIKYQKVQGWGGAFTDSTGYNIKTLNEAAQENLLQSYFSDEGIEYSLCRVPIAGTDFSLRSYSYNDGNVDEELSNFKLAFEDLAYKIPLIQRAFNLSKNNLKLFASAWTAPKWIKTNGEHAGTGFIRKEMYQVWANYYIKFLEKYRNQGINFWGLTTGNEPSVALVPFGKINSVAWIPSDMRDWILNNLGPTIKGSEFSGIKLITLDDQRMFLPLVDIVLGQNATQYIDGIAVHWYYDKFVPASFLVQAHNQHPDKFILATEASLSLGNKPFEQHTNLGSWANGERYAESIIEDMSNWVEGWIDWNMALDLTGGPTYIENNLDSPILVNRTAGEFYKQPMFYAVGHFSKFIPIDSVRISATGFDLNVPVVAFRRPDNGTVIVILNKEEKAVSVNIDANLHGTSIVEVSEKSITTLLYW